MANPCSLRPGEAQEKVSLCSSWKVPRQTVFDFNFRSDRISSPSDVPTWSYNHKSLFRKMLPLPWLVLVAAPLVFSQPAPQNCCETKTVGGVSYTWDSFLFFFIDLCWPVLLFVVTITIPPSGLFVRTRQPSATLASPLVCMRETTSLALPSVLHKETSRWSCWFLCWFYLAINQSMMTWWNAEAGKCQQLLVMASLSVESIKHCWIICFQGGLRRRLRRNRGWVSIIFLKSWWKTKYGVFSTSSVMSHHSHTPTVSLNVSVLVSLVPSKCLEAVKSVTKYLALASSNCSILW